MVQKKSGESKDYSDQTVIVMLVVVVLVTLASMGLYLNQLNKSKLTGINHNLEGLGDNSGQLSLEIIKPPEMEEEIDIVENEAVDNVEAGLGK
ncbi:MAG TPA: hypothetical protein VJC39_02430 [Candidatus Nanoarchaeia archaeon]|nr:hypothetical protein [Candidatus Nanoarchaeia archaeon]